MESAGGIPPSLHRETIQPELSPPMPILPETDIDVSPLCLGSWALAGGLNWGPQDEQASVATIHAALDHGITFIDTAPLYGDGKAEELIGRALKEKPADPVIASKVSSQDVEREALIASCERSLKRLGRDTLDLLQVHWPNHEVPFEETVGALEALKEQGKIRAYGVSNFNATDLAKWREAGGQAVTNQLPYSLLWRAIEYEILPACRDAGVGVLCYSPLMQGLLTGKFKEMAEVPEERARTRHFSSEHEHARHGEGGAEPETQTAIQTLAQTCEAFGYSMAHAALAWVLKQPGVVSALLGVRSPEQVEQNIAALEVDSSDSFMIQLSALTDPLKVILGENPDPWESPGRF